MHARVEHGARAARGSHHQERDAWQCGSAAAVPVCTARLARQLRAPTGTVQRV